MEPQCCFLRMIVFAGTQDRINLITSRQNKDISRVTICRWEKDAVRHHLAVGEAEL